MSDDQQPPPDWVAPGSDPGSQATPPPGPPPPGPPPPAAPQWPPPAPTQPGVWGPPAPPAAKRPIGLIIGAAVAVAVLAIGGAIVGAVALSGDESAPRATQSAEAPAANGQTSAAPVPETPTASTPSSPPPARSLSLPKSVAGFDRQTGNVARRVIGEMRKAMANSDPMFKANGDKMKTGLYAKDGEQVIFMGFSYTEMFGQGLPPDESPSTAVDTMFVGMGVPDTKDYPEGRLGGELRCGQAKSQGISMQVCAWADASVLGIVIGPTTPQKELSSVTLKFREAAER
ncbi:hypothetical protein ACGFNU_14055 [Spirillospora sp. NPDC048911]|uniref:hypothetical protein n=1 Tax=Spirillospora sp. NPDC048911 TaxID=3364527 RepID=UPI003711C736